MEKQEKKSEVKNVEKVEKETTTTASSYVAIGDLTASEIRNLCKVKCSFIPRITKTSKSYTYEFTLHENGLIINSLGDTSKYRENISLDEFNQVRLANGKTDGYFLLHQFEANIYYRLVKGYKQDGEKYYSVQFWLAPNGRCHTHFFSQTELALMVSIKKANRGNFKFIEKPKDLIEDEVSNTSNDLDLDIL